MFSPPSPWQKYYSNWSGRRDLPIKTRRFRSAFTFWTDARCSVPLKITATNSHWIFHCANSFNETIFQEFMLNKWKNTSYFAITVVAVVANLNLITRPTLLQYAGSRIFFAFFYIYKHLQAFSGQIRIHAGGHCLYYKQKQLGILHGTVNKIQHTSHTHTHTPNIHIWVIYKKRKNIKFHSQLLGCFSDGYRLMALITILSVHPAIYGLLLREYTHSLLDNSTNTQ